LTTLETIAARDVLDARGVKGVAAACAQTSFVEDDRDFIGGVAVQQAVDFLDDLGA
jgi:hypothetical protein